MTVTVLHVLEAVEGGTARHVVDLVRTVEGVRHEVALPQRRSVGVTDAEAAAAIEAAGGRVHFVEMRRQPHSPRNAIATLALRDLLRNLRPSIVHGHSSIGGALSRLAAWRQPVAVVYTPNGIAATSSARAIERFLARRTDRFIAVSASEGELALKLGLVDTTGLRVVPNAIDLTPPPPLDPTLRHRLGIGDDVPLVGTIARLVAQKAPEVFVASCAVVAQRVPSTQFVLIGDGPLRREVDDCVARAGLAGRFHQIRELPAAARSLGELDVFVLTSRFEGGPYSPLEAMRAGTPVVLTNVTGNRDLIEHGVSGLLVDKDDHRQVAGAITTLLTDEALRAELAEQAVLRLASAFDLRQMGPAIASVYEELVSTPKKRKEADKRHVRSGRSSRSFGRERPVP